MIEGLKVTIAGDELRTLCYERADRCQSQADKADDQAGSIERDALGATGYTNGDPVRALRDLKERYAAEAKELRFIGDHIDIDEEYYLQRADLAYLGIVSRSY